MTAGSRRYKARILGKVMVTPTSLALKIGDVRKAGNLSMSESFLLISSKQASEEEVQDILTFPTRHKWVARNFRLFLVDNTPFDRSTQRSSKSSVLKVIC